MALILLASVDGKKPKRVELSPKELRKNYSLNVAPQDRLQVHRCFGLTTCEHSRQQAIAAVPPRKTVSKAPVTPIDLGIEPAKTPLVKAKGKVAAVGRSVYH